MASQVIHDDDVAGREGWHEELLDPGEERPAVDRSINDTGGIDPVVTKRCQEG